MTPATELKSRKEIRVILTSTVKDMQAERNYLIRQVIPTGSVLTQS